MKYFNKSIKRLLPLLLLAASLAGCATTIARADLQKRLLESPPPLIVDVRSGGEYSADHIPGAVHIPFYSIGSGLKQLAFPKGKPVIIYCEHGPRAGLAGISLYFQGFEKVYSLDGHMKGWRESGLPIEKTPGAH